MRNLKLDLSACETFGKHAGWDEVVSCFEWGMADMGGCGRYGRGGEGMYELSEEQQGVGHKLPLLDQDASTLDGGG